MIRLAIKYNNCGVSCSCAICGKGMDYVPIPLALFMEGSYHPVCGECGEKHAPEMIRMLEDFYEKEWIGVE